LEAMADGFRLFLKTQSAVWFFFFTITTPTPKQQKKVNDFHLNLIYISIKFKINSLKI